MILQSLVKENSVVIDVGCHKTTTGHFVGEVEFEAASRRAAFITPVPGGVGPMTVCYAMYNTILACARRLDIELPMSLYDD